MDRFLFWTTRFLVLGTLLLLLSTGGCRQATRQDLTQDLLRIEQRRERAQLLEQQGREALTPQRRRELLGQAVQLDPMLGPVQNNLGVAFFELGEYYQAALHLRQAANLMGAAPGPWANLAVLHAELGQWPRALQYALEAKARDGNDLLTLRVLARALCETRSDATEIEVILKELVVRDPSEAWRKWAITEQKALIDRRPIWE